MRIAEPFLRISVVAALAWSALISAEPQITTEVTREFPSEKSELKPDPVRVYGILDNGLRYFIMPNEQPKGKVSLRLQVQSGSLHETDEQCGYAHYLEHLAFRGTEHYPPGKIIGILQALGIKFGQHSNAHTGFDETVYKLDLPDGEEGTLATGLQVMADFAAGMMLLPEEIEHERGVILAEMRDRNSPGFRKTQALFRAMYKGLAIADRFPIGTEESIKAASVDPIRAYYDQWYRPERMLLVAVGEVIPAMLAEQIKSEFGGIKGVGPAPKEVVLGTLAPDAMRVLYHREVEDDSTSLLFVNVRAEDRGHDSAVLRKRLMAQDLAESILNRRLQDYIESHPSGPLLEGGSSSEWWLKMFEAFVDVTVQPGKAHEAIGVVEQELRRFIQYGPTKGELAVAKADYLASLDEAVARANSRTNAELAERIYKDVQDDMVFTTPQLDRELEMPWLADMEVKEVQASMQKAWANGHFLLAVLGRDDYGANAEESFKADYLASQNVAVTPPVETNSLQWGYGEKEPVGSIEVEKIADFDIIQMRFANQVNANIKRTEFKPGEVQVQLRIQIPVKPYKAGVWDLASRAFIAGGLGKHSAADLRAILAGKTVHVQGPIVEEDSILFLANCLPKELELCCQELRAYLLDPGWRPEAEATAKTQWLEELRSQVSNLDAQVAIRFKALIVHDEPHRRAATEEEAKAVTFADVRAWLEPLLTTSPLTVSVIGDLDVGRTKQMMMNYFSNLPVRQANVVIPDVQAPDVTVPTEPMPTGTHLYAVPGSVPRALVRISWPTDDFYDVPKMRRLGLLSEVLTNSLREQLREKLGQAYSPYATRWASETYQDFGYIMAQVAVASDKADEARHLMLDVASELAEKGVSAYALNQVKTPIVKSLGAIRQQNQYWLALVMSRCQSQPQRLEWAKTIEEDYGAITSAELTELAKEYFVPERTLQVVGICNGADAPDKALK